MDLSATFILQFCCAFYSWAIPPRPAFLLVTDKASVLFFIVHMFLTSKLILGYTQIYRRTDTDISCSVSSFPGLVERSNWHILQEISKVGGIKHLLVEVILYEKCVRQIFA